MTTFIWIYAIAGSLICSEYFDGNQVVVHYATGPALFLVVMAPIVLLVLVLAPLAQRAGLRR